MDVVYSDMVTKVHQVILRLTLPLVKHGSHSSHIVKTNDIFKVLFETFVTDIYIILKKNDIQLFLIDCF